MDIVILSTTRRMGSTLVQRIFNSRKQTLIWGEQNGILRHFNLMLNQITQFNKVENYEKESFFNGNRNLWSATLNPGDSIIIESIQKSMKCFLDNLYGNNYRSNNNCCYWNSIHRSNEPWRNITSRGNKRIFICFKFNDISFISSFKWNSLPLS